MVRRVLATLNGETMDFVVEELTGPTNPSDFVGRNEIIDQYQNLLRDFVRSNPTVKWVHISGVSGVGKSSLLRKLRMMTEMERIATGSVEVPISPKSADQFLTDVKRVIEEMSPEWRSFIQRKRGSEITKVDKPPESLGLEISEQQLSTLEDQFFRDLDKVDKAMKREREKNGLFVDDIDRFAWFGYTSLINIWKKIATRLKNDDHQLLFVTAGNSSINGILELEDFADNVLHLEVTQFDFTEAELMVRRRGKLVKSDREEVVQSSTRFPFDLALRQLVKSKDMDPSNLDLKTTTAAFGFSQEEVNLLKDIAKKGSNYFQIEEFTLRHEMEVINGLRDSLLFSISQDGVFSFESRAMWEFLSQVYMPIDPRTEVILILDRLNEQATKGQLPSNREINIVKEHFQRIDDKSLIYELAGQLADSAKAALEGELIQTAWELLELATIGLRRTNDFEKIADLQEALAKGFAKSNHDYFAAKAFEKAGSYFKNAGIEWRSVSNYREAGQKYKKEADKTDPKTFHYAIRNMLKHAISAYLAANEPRRAGKVKDDAIDILQDFDVHVKFFEEMEITQ